MQTLKRNKKIAYLLTPIALASAQLIMTIAHADDVVGTLPTVEVVGVSPVASFNIPLNQYPGNIQVLRENDIESQKSSSFSELLGRSATSVTLNEIQGNPFQLDLNYRGQRLSSVLGSAQGISAYLDGVRINEAFGDVISWDMLPESAISTITMIPGSNPMYGMNTLSGALVMTTKNGLTHEGNEVELTAVAFGSGQTRYKEEKRVVFNKNIGPLISTDMTRCIQCTRCVRFLQEVGGMMELGMVGRGEHSEITAYVDRSIQSELSGNIIDLCPVGALTSKPFRYKARTWELIRRPTLAHHDSLGSPLEAHIKQNKVIRMLPREDETINECWISDRDRFSYEGLNSEDRLQVPMIKEKGQWKESDWETALTLIGEKLKSILDHDGPEALGILISPQSTIEEGILAKKISNTLKSPHIDHRIRQSDFSIEHEASPWLGSHIDAIGQFDQYLLIGSNIRNEQPLLTSRIRKSVNQGASLFVINSIDADPLMTVAEKMIQTSHKLPHALAKVLKSMTEIKGVLKKDIKFYQASTSELYGTVKIKYPTELKGQLYIPSTKLS